jgi:DNA sulfur modification protein DndE
MYYNGRDFSESEANPKIEAKPVSEETPQFRSFFIRNITCKGAENGIVIRGLPEMNVKNIVIENCNIEAKKGFYCIEGDGISLKNVNLLTTHDETLVTISNSKNISIDNIKFSEKVKTVLNINGNRSEKIRLVNTKTDNIKEAVKFGEGVSKKVLIKK